MITELRVRDLATIADVTMQPGPGLNVLTGETGAGKSLLVDSIALLLGDRAEGALVRPGAPRAAIDGVFEVTSAALRRQVEMLGLEPEEDRVVVRREISAEGRSRAWVNGSPTTVGVLARLGSLFVDLHGQHETQSLLRADAQREILDAFAAAAPERAAVAEAHAAAASLAEEETALNARRDDVLRRADYLHHVVEEIDQAGLKPNEDEGLELEARRLSHAGALIESALRLVGALEGEESSALAALAEADRAMGALTRHDPSVETWREMLDTAYANLREVARSAGEYAERVDQDPRRLEEIERRRDLLGRLKQKYGATLGAVLENRAQAASELDLLDTADFDLRAIAARRQAAEAALRAVTGALTEKRQEAAGRLARSVNRLLPQLGLPGGRLEVELVALPGPGRSGQESAAYMVRLNPGMDPRPLSRSASGGELSRIMLALKVVLAQHDQVPTLVFDEVDQGIGGEVAGRVAEALAQVATHRQVLVITHLPQIAARADRHLVVAKAARRGLATSDVQHIHGEDRVAEIARMLGDEEGETARQHAVTLLGRRE